MENLETDRRSQFGLLNDNKKINPKSLSLKNKFSVKKKINESLTCKTGDNSHGFEVMKHFLNAKNSESPSSTGTSKDVASSSKDDSLKDFRSPARDTDMNESLDDFKISVPNKRLVLKESKQIVKKKKGQNRKAASNVNQPSIESSFFKPKTEVQTAFLCPLCFKSYKEATARTNHMKSCAARNNLSTKQLLDAVELQEKQANERKAMGLIVAPPVQPKKTISRKMISEKDPQLQLALALSMSLHEAQMSEEIEEAHLLEGEPFFPINGEISEERRKTLQSFGFTTNKPAVAAYVGNRSRKKRPAGPTVLQTRTQEERDRITTVRIAEVLMGDERVTQAMQHDEEIISQVDDNIELKSRLLRSYHRVEDRLWDKTQQTVNGQNLYPYNNTLESSPSKVKSESKIDKTEQNAAEQKDSKEGENNLPSTTPDKNIISDRLNSESSSESSIDDDTVRVKSKVDRNSFMDLSKDWRSMVGASYMSDILVVVKGDHTIHAHRLVFWARCYSMIDDVTENDPERFWEVKHRILWPETELGSAYAFLEFLYCGSIESHESIFNCAELLAGVRALARKYQLKKLFVYLRDKSNELKINSLKLPNKRSSETRTSLKSRPANNSDDSSSLPSGIVSICSKETDIHSRSTDCNDLLTDKQDVEEEIFDKDNLCRRLIEEQENENIFSRSSLKVNTSTSANNFSDARMSQEIPTSIEATFIDTKRNESISKNVSTSNMKDFYDTLNDGCLNVVDDKNFERERSISPDMFDDSETENAACSYSVSKEHCHVPDYETKGSDADIELLCSPKEDKETEGEILNEGMNLLDREISVAEISNGEENCEILKKPEVDLRFVSTRRTRKNIQNSLSPNINLDIENLNRTKSLSGTFTKKKGDMTMFIEKIQKWNSKTVFESDSESELVEAYQTKKRKNPFRINITRSSSAIEDNINPELDDDVPRRRRNKLSIFEKKIEILAAKNPTMFNLPTHLADSGSRNTKLSDNSKSTASTSGLENMKLQNEDNKPDDESFIELSQKPAATLNDSDDSVFDLTQGSSRESMLDSDKDTCDTNTDDKDLSMFTKYKRKHSRNSIDKYRAALRNASLATSVSSSKATGGDLSFDESLDLENGVKSIARSSKYEYTDPNQSTSNFQRELLSMSSKSSPEIFSPEESEDREKSSVKFADAELSDLDIDLADFSSIRYSDKLNESRRNGRSQGKCISVEKFSDSIFDDTFDDTPEKIVDVPVCALNVKLEDTKVTVARSNLSEEDTETECWIESVVPKNGKRSLTDKEKLTDIHDEETDTEEMGDRGSQSKPSCSKSKMNVTSIDVSKEMRKSESLVGDSSERSSPECEITGMFLSSSMNFDFVKDVSDEVGLLLEECKTSDSKTLHNSSSISKADSISDPFASTSKNSRLDINDYSNFTPYNVANDYDDDNFLRNESLPEAHCSNRESLREKPVNVEDREECSKASAKKKYNFSDSDSSEYEDFKIRKRNSKTSISSGNRSEVMEKVSRSTSLRCGNVSPKNNSTPLRSLKTKSVSENILKSKPMSERNFMDNSYDGKSKSTVTQSVDQKISKRHNQTTPQRELASENVTPLADYSAMNTPELRKELGKYGFKPQKRHRAKQLLRYIYNELHPLVPVAGSNIPSYSNVSSSDDDMPAPKRLNKSKSLDAVNDGTCEDGAESNRETLALDPRIESDASDDNELENYDLYQLSQSDSKKNLENAFRQLIEADRDLHNKILTYQPLKLEELHSTLKSKGYKCKLDSLMNFLDEQCITFRQMTNAKKSRTKRKLSPKKNSNTLGKEKMLQK